MSQDNFDRHIREQLQNHQSKVDAEALWEAIGPKRPRRKFLIWWLLPLLILVGITAYGWQQKWWSFGSNSELPLSHQLEVEMIQTTQTQESLKVDPVPEQTVQSQQLTPALKPALSAPTTAIEERGGTSIGIAKDEVAEAVAHLPISPPSSSVSPKQADVFYTEQKSYAANLIEVLAIQADYDRPQEELPLIVFSEPTDQEAIEEDGSFFFDLRFGLFKPQRSLEPDSLSELGEWLLNREDTETTLEAWSLDFNIGHQYPSGVYFYTGLGYSQLIERFEYQETNISIDTVDNAIVEIRINANGDSTLILGTRPQVTTQTSLRKNFNSIRQLDIPVIFGYRFGDSRLGLFTEAGIRFNLRQSVEGLRFSPESEVIDLADNSYFRSSVGFSAQLGFGLSWQWTSRISLSASTNFRYHFSDVNQKSTGFKERYQWLGGQLGIRYYF